jgi:hypothetical protein
MKVTFKSNFKELDKYLNKKCLEIFNNEIEQKLLSQNGFKVDEIFAELVLEYIENEKLFRDFILDEIIENKDDSKDGYLLELEEIDEITMKVFSNKKIVSLIIDDELLSYYIDDAYETYTDCEDEDESLNTDEDSTVYYNAGLYYPKYYSQEVSIESRPSYYYSNISELQTLNYDCKMTEYVSDTKQKQEYNDKILKCLKELESISKIREEERVDLSNIEGYSKKQIESIFKIISKKNKENINEDNFQK